MDLTLDRRTMLSAGLAATLAAALPRASHGQTPQLFAFVAGNDRYTRMTTLTKAAADARAVAKRLRKFNYRTFEAINEPKQRFVAIFDEFKSAMAAGGSAFIFYSGHGVQINGTNFLLPTDADCSDNERFRPSAISLTAMLGQLRDIRPSQTVVLLDACRVAPGPITLTGKGEGVASVNAPKGFFVAYSAGMGEYALDRLSPDDRDPNGLFTRYFLQNLRPDAPVDALVMQTSVKVSAAAETAGYSQNCAIYNQSPRRLRLDGLTVETDDWITAAPGVLEKTHVSLIGWSNYQEYSANMANLINTQNDVRRLAGLFQSLGATVSTFFDCTREVLHERLPGAIPAAANRHIIYYTGSGGTIDGEVAMMIGGRGPGGIDVMSAAELLAVAEGMPTAPYFPFGQTGAIADDREPLKMDFNKLKHDTILMFDTSLSDFDLPAPAKTRKHALLEWLASADTNQSEARFAILTSCGIFQNVLDSFDEDVNVGAFAIALENALKRPQLTLGQVADRVRAEVEMLTNHFQTPALYASTKFRDVVLVESAAAS